jgi:outer membrane protein TolC
MAAAKSDTDSIGWTALGPQLQGTYSYGGLNSRVSGVSSGLQEQQKASAGAGFSLGASSFGQMKTAKANFRSAAIDVDRQLDRVKAQVISAQQSSITAAQLVPTAHAQLQAAEEALRLAQANLKSGTMLLVDVLQSQNQVDDARLRHADAVVKYNQSQINLLAALGLLEASKFLPPTSQLSAAPADPRTPISAD